MIIFVLEDYYIIKIIIPDVSYFSQNESTVNLSWNFSDLESYKDKLDFLIKGNSEKIMNYFINKGIFANPVISSKNKQNQDIHILINEDLNKISKYEEKKKLL